MLWRGDKDNRLITITQAGGTITWAEWVLDPDVRTLYIRPGLPLHVQEINQWEEKDQKSEGFQTFGKTMEKRTWARVSSKLVQKMEKNGQRNRSWKVDFSQSSGRFSKRKDRKRKTALEKSKERCFSKVLGFQGGKWRFFSGENWKLHGKQNVGSPDAVQMIYGGNPRGEWVVLRTCHRVLISVRDDPQTPQSRRAFPGNPGLCGGSLTEFCFGCTYVRTQACIICLCACVCVTPDLPTLDSKLPCGICEVPRISSTLTSIPGRHEVFFANCDALYVLRFASCFVQSQTSNILQILWLFWRNIRWSFWRFGAKCVFSWSALWLAPFDLFLSEDYWLGRVPTDFILITPFKSNTNLQRGDILLILMHFASLS